MKLDMVGIIVSDMAKALEFYQLLDFDISYGNAEADYVELQHDGVRISLNTTSMITAVLGFAPESVGDKIELAFLADSVAQVDEKITLLGQHGYTIVRQPWQAPWGQYYGLVRDADGNIISLFYQ